MQNNHLSGALDVLSNLTLVDLNIENNLFSGRTPPKLRTILKFQKDGNSFVDSIDSVLPSTSPSPSPPRILVSDAPAPSVSSQFEVTNLSGGKEGKSIWKVIAYAVITIASFISVVLTVTIFILKVKVLTKEDEDPPIMQCDKLKCIKSAKSNLPTTIIKCSGKNITLSSLLSFLFFPRFSIFYLCVQGSLKRKIHCVTITLHSNIILIFYSNKN
jgi:hypothetical protein